MKFRLYIYTHIQTELCSPLDGPFMFGRICKAHVYYDPQKVSCTVDICNMKHDLEHSLSPKKLS